MPSPIDYWWKYFSTINIEKVKSCQKEMELEWMKYWLKSRRKGNLENNLLQVQTIPNVSDKVKSVIYKPKLYSSRSIMIMSTEIAFQQSANCSSLKIPWSRCKQAAKGNIYIQNKAFRSYKELSFDVIANKFCKLSYLWPPVGFLFPKFIWKHNKKAHNFFIKFIS